MKRRTPLPLFEGMQLRVFSVLSKKGAVEVLALLLSNPDQEFTARGIARICGIPTMSCSRILHELHGLGIVNRRRIGGAYLISLREDSSTTEFVKRLVKACKYE
jgi:DNA-binding IclR family transcriptional regulator